MLEPSHPPLIAGATMEPWLLAEEISHRVANEYAAAIASLSLAAARCTHVEARIALEAGARRLFDHAAVHRALQPPAAAGLADASLADLSHHLRGLCGAMVRASLAERKIALTLMEAPIELEPHQCWRVGLIVSELITNSARHALLARGGQIVVELAVHDNAIQCRVSDDGMSLDPKPGRGTAIVGALARDLGGRIDWHFGPRGTTALLCFPSCRVASQLAA